MIHMDNYGKIFSDCLPILFLFLLFYIATWQILDGNQNLSQIAND